MSLRRFVLVTHRWIGITTSLVLAIVGSTGAIMVWEGRNLIQRISGRLHESLALGKVGAWIVIAASIAAVLLQIGGIVLWWKRKRIAIRTSANWRVTLNDLHHSTGALGLAIMFALTLTAVGLSFVTPQEDPELRRVLMRFHTAREFPLPVRLLYMVATMGFLVQAATGIVMWWKPSRGARRQSAPSPAR